MTNTLEKLEELEDQLLTLQVKVMQGNNLTMVGITNSHKEEVMQLLEEKVKEYMVNEEENYILIQAVKNFIEANL